jgi:hypothetical protein
MQSFLAGVKFQQEWTAIPGQSQMPRVVEGGTWQGGTVTQKDAEICSVKDDRHGEKAEATLSIYQSD